MKLYLLTRTDEDNIGTDEYDGVVVAAESRLKAKKVINHLVCDKSLKEDWKCSLISDIAKSSIKEGIVLVSFNG